MKEVSLPSRPPIFSRTFITGFIFSPSEYNSHLQGGLKINTIWSAFGGGGGTFYKKVLPKQKKVSPKKSLLNKKFLSSKISPKQKVSLSQKSLLDEKFLPQKSFLDEKFLSPKISPRQKVSPKKNTPRQKSFSKTKNFLPHTPHFPLCGKCNSSTRQRRDIPIFSRTSPKKSTAQPCFLGGIFISRDSGRKARSCGGIYFYRCRRADRV